jgi:hypothetical protein
LISSGADDAVIKIWQAPAGDKKLKKQNKKFILF